ncbi:tetratricopeptide repeat protein [Magnetovirga frankeli]|uniref:tetratricopeptide repeat protein n=1 Tax=Magnetovirga frankeli TaxID=947516 RepID=UPI001293F699
MALKRLGRFAEAERCYRQALQWVPDSADILANLADNSSEAGDYTQAIAYADQALKSQPNHLGARINKATALYAALQPEESLKIFE